MKAKIFPLSKHSRYLAVLSVISADVDRSQRKSGASQTKLTVFEDKYRVVQTKLQAANVR